MTWVTDHIALGGGIWTDDKMIEVVRAGVTHIVDMQIEREGAVEPHRRRLSAQAAGAVPARRGVWLEALDDAENKVFIHCTADVHRAPMMTLAVLWVLGFGLDDATETLLARRKVVDLPMFTCAALRSSSAATRLHSRSAVSNKW